MEQLSTTLLCLKYIIIMIIYVSIEKLNSLRRDTIVTITKLSVPCQTFSAEPWQKDYNTLHYNCWENYIGAQLYQLCIVDFIVFCTSLFLSEVLRNILINNVKWIRARVEQPEFNIPKEILDLCYKQMIFWSAIFFSPLMSCVAVIEVRLLLAQ